MLKYNNEASTRDLTCVIVVMLLLIAHACGYTCVSETVTASPTIPVGAAVTIKGCVFNMGITITNPSSVAISDAPSTFKGGLSIIGDNAAPFSGSITLHALQVTQGVVLRSIKMNNGGQSITISEMTARGLDIDGCEFRNGATFTADRVDVSEYGLQLKSVVLNATTMIFKKSSFISTQAATSTSRSGLLIQDGQFVLESQLTLEDTNITSNREGVFFYAKNNCTVQTRRLSNGKTASTHRCYADAFRDGSVLQFTNTNVTSKEADCMRSYEAITGLTSYYRHGTFIGGAKFLAENSVFNGPATLRLHYGSTAELDAASYENVDLTIQGNSETGIVIPIPHTINVKSLTLSNCRVHLPHLNVPSPSHSTWDVHVQVSLSINDVQLGNGQQFVLRPYHSNSETWSSQPRLYFSNANFSGSTFDVAGFSTISVTGVFENTTFSIADTHKASSIDIKGIFVDNAQLLLTNYSLSSINLHHSAFSAGSFLHLQDTIVNGLVLDEVIFNSGSYARVDNLVAKLYGVQLKAVEVNATAFVIANSTLVSTVVTENAANRFGLLIEDGKYSNRSQLVLHNTTIVAVREAIFLYADNNSTRSAYKNAAGKTITTHKHYADAFHSGSVLRFSNVNVTSSESYSLQSYEHTSSGTSSITIHYRYGRFIDGAKFVASNSEFNGAASLRLHFHSTAELDAASYKDIDLSVQGDSDTNIVIPIPHTIVVRSLSLSNCRVHLPDLNVPTPLKNIWDVQVTNTLLVNDVRLANRQQMILRPTSTDSSQRPRVTIYKANFTSDSLLDIVGFHYVLVKGVFNNNSTFKITDTSSNGGSVDISAVFSSGSKLFLANSNFGSVSVHHSVFIVNSFFFTQSVVLNSLTLAAVAFKTGSHARVESVLVKLYGMQLKSVEIDAATFLITNNTIVSEDTRQAGTTRFGLLIEDGKYTNGSKLLVEDSTIRADREAVYYYAQTNSTHTSYKNAGGKTITTYKHIADAFRSGSVLEFVNTNVTSRWSKCFQSYEYTSVGHSASSATIRYRYGRFIQGAKFVATNSHFNCSCDLQLAFGGTAVIDAATYKDIDLKIVGDSDASIVVPIPHTIQVKMLHLLHCRVYLPDINVPAPLKNRWHVHVTEKLVVNDVRLANNQQVLLQPTTAGDAPRVEFTKANFSSGSRLDIVEFGHVYVTGTFQNSTTMNVTDMSNSGGGIDVRGAEFAMASRLLLINSLAWISLRDCTFTADSFFLVKDAQLNGLTLLRVGFSIGSHARVENALVRAYGVQLRYVEIDAAIFLFTNNTILCTDPRETATTRYGFLVEDGRYTNGSQLIVEDTSITSVREAVYYLAPTNFTLHQRKLQSGSTISTYRYYADAFCGGSVWKFTNSVVKSKESSCFQSYFYSSTGFTVIHRYGRFVHGAKFVSINSHFNCSCDLQLAAKGTAEIDAPTFKDINLTVVGDDAERIAVPVPHIISVYSLTFTKCRVHLPDLNIPNPTQNVFKVDFARAFKVNDVRLANSQVFLLRGGGSGKVAGTVELKNFEFDNSSALQLFDSRLTSFTIGGRFHNQSGLSIVNTTFVHVTLTSLNIMDNAGVRFENCSASSSFTVAHTFLSNNAALVITESTMIGYISFRYSLLEKSSTFSLSNSTFIGRRGAQRAIFHFLDTFFVGSNLCIRDVMLGDSCTPKGGAFHFTGTGTRALSFVNGSYILISNSHFACVGGTYSDNFFTNMVGDDDAKYATIGGVGDRGSNGTKMIVQNSRFSNGTCKLYLQGNGTDIAIDPSSLSNGDFHFETSVTTKSPKQDMDAVTVYIPSSFECGILSVQGARIRWLHEAPTTVLPRDGTPHVRRTTHYFRVMKGLQLRYPLRLDLFGKEMLRVVPASPFVLPTTVHVGGITLRDESALIISNFTSGPITSIAVEHCNVQGAKSFVIMNDAVTSTTVSIMNTKLVGGGTLILSNLITQWSLGFSGLMVTNQSAVIIYNVTTLERGVTLYDSNFDDKSVFVVKECTLKATNGYGSRGVFDVRGSTFSGQGTTLLVADSTFNVTTANGVGITLGYRATTANSALISFTGNTIASTTTAVSSLPTSHIGGTLLVEKTTYTSAKKADITLDRGTLLIGNGMGRSELFVKSEGAAMNHSKLYCSASSNQVCSDATIIKKNGPITVVLETNGASAVLNAAVSASDGAKAGSTARIELGKQTRDAAPKISCGCALDDKTFNDEVAASMKKQCERCSANKQWADYYFSIVAPPPGAPTPTMQPSSIPESPANPLPSANSNISASSGSPGHWTLPDGTISSWPPGPTDPDGSQLPQPGSPTGPDGSIVEPSTGPDGFPLPPPVATGPNGDHPSDGSSLPTPAPLNIHTTSSPASTGSDTGNESSTHQPPSSNLNETLHPTKSEKSSPTTSGGASPSEKAAGATTAATATTIGIPSSAAGGAAAADMQTLMVLGFTLCASDTMRAMAQASRRTLYPLDEIFGDFDSSRLLGNFVLLGLFGLLHLAVVYILAKKKRKPFRKAAARMKFPSFSLLVMNLLYQGFVLEASLILFRKTFDRSTLAITLAAITLLLSLAIPIVYVIWCHQHVNDFRFFRYDHSTRNCLLARFVFATGQWDPKNVKLSMFRNLCGSLDGTKWWMFSSSMQIRSLFVAMIAANEHLPCKVQALLLCLVFMLHALLLVVFRPLRMRAANVFSPLGSFFSGLVALTLFDDRLAKYSAMFLLCTSFIVVVGAIVQLLALLVEFIWKKRKECIFLDDVGPSDSEDDDLQNAVMNSNDGSSTTTSEEEDDDDATEMMQVLSVPLCGKQRTEEDDEDGSRSHNPLSS